jgi:hypothetical protein
VLHYKAYSEDGITGISVLSRAADVIDTAKAAQKYKNRLYTQNAKPSAVLKSTQPLEPQAKDRVRAEWDKIYSGADNAFRVAILDLGLDYQQISLSNKDTQFVESKGFTDIVDDDCEIKADATEDDLACIESIKVKQIPTKSGDMRTEREVKLSSKMKALELLGKHLGMWNDKLDVNLNIPVVISGEDALEE